MSKLWQTPKLTSHGAVRGSDFIYYHDILPHQQTFIIPARSCYPSYVSMVCILGIYGNTTSPRLCNLQNSIVHMLRFKLKWFQKSKSGLCVFLIICVTVLFPQATIPLKNKNHCDSASYKEIWYKEYIFSSRRKVQFTLIIGGQLLEIRFPLMFDIDVCRVENKELLLWNPFGLF